MSPGQQLCSGQTPFSQPVSWTPGLGGGGVDPNWLLDPAGTFVMGKITRKRSTVAIFGLFNPVQDFLVFCSEFFPVWS